MPNITVAVDDKNLIREVRAIAARRGTSLSALVRTYLRGLVDSGAPKEPGADHALRVMRKGLSLGGKPVSRNTLHER